MIYELCWINFAVAFKIKKIKLDARNCDVGEGVSESILIDFISRILPSTNSQ